ncbi:ribosome maturation factor RimM [Curtanaerobium respiraculi]|uniref:ribosome maturation factor RimM n=1 Tax=Curtanaerobium respiraculi TaxID=2949669 RepID=UPI0024B36E0C|nr:16S rRNA processing protein RimM [Curtanaerobium respiraculi]
MSGWRRVARIVKPRNLEGSLIVCSTDGLPFLLEAGMRVWFVPPTLRGPREARVVSADPLGGSDWDVRFDAVADRSAAEQLVGSYCLVEKSDLPHDIDGAAAPVGLEGWRVRDRVAGDLGVVAEVVENPAQALLRVEGPRGEVLIPAVAEFVAEVDGESGLILVDIPQSLIDLNAGAGE